MYRLITDGKAEDRFAHALVAEVFIGPRPEGMYVCHGNGDPLDNRLANLRYDTPAGNSADAKRHGTQHRGSRTGGSKLDEQAASEIQQLLAAGEIEQQEIARRYGVSKSAITDIKKGRTWSWLRQSPHPFAAA